MCETKIKTAILSLMGHCDGARTKDGMGFNGPDATWMRAVLTRRHPTHSVCFFGVGEYTRADIEDALNNFSFADLKNSQKRLIKYERQLHEYGFEDLAFLQATLTPPTTSINAYIEDEKLIVVTPYDKEFTAEIRNVETRRWNGKVNTFSPRVAEEVFVLVKKHYGVDISFDVPPTPVGRITADGVENPLKIATEYQKAIVDTIKTLTRRRWEGKVWEVEIVNLRDVETIKSLVDNYDIEISPDAQKYIDERIGEIENAKERKAELIEMSNKASLDNDEDIPHAPADMDYYPFQKVGIRFLQKNKGRGLIADDMGLGKTIQALGYLHITPEAIPALIVCPSSVKENWRREILIWTNTRNEEIQTIRGRKDIITKGMKFYIINYDILAYYTPKLEEMKMHTLIMDESHYIKNHNAKRSKSALSLSRSIPRVICLTGTPVLNRPVEIYTSIRAIGVDDPMLKDFWTFAKRYCNAYNNGFGWTFTHSNLDELNIKLRENIMIRRTKDAVLKDLPKKRRIQMFFEATNMPEYRTAEQNLQKWLDEYAENIVLGDNTLTKIEKLKQIAVDGKTKDLIDWLDNMVETNGKIVVFAHHIKLQKRLYEHYGEKAVWVRGGEESQKKDAEVEKFNNNPEIRVCVASLLGAREGINLQKSCSTVVFAELGWTPSGHQQAEDRVHRIGQEKPVEIYYTLTSGTIEEDIWELLNEKQRVIEQAVDGVTDEKELKGILVALVERIRGRNAPAPDPYKGFYD